MDIDRLQDKERRDILAQMAEMYYNQGRTQSEIADHFGTNRFRVARMIQEAKQERIVEIRIHFSDERNKGLEQELKGRLGLKDVLVVHTRYSSYIDVLAQIGEAGADYLARLLEPGAVLGVTWGKTLYSVINRLPDLRYNPVTAVQLAGHSPTTNPEVDARELARVIEGFLDTLTTRERVIFMRRYAYLDTYADIAERVGISEKNVSVRLARVRKQLKTYLREKEDLK